MPHVLKLITIAAKIQALTSILRPANVNATMFAPARIVFKLGLDIQHVDAYVDNNPIATKTRLGSALLAPASAKVALAARIPDKF